MKEFIGRKKELERLEEIKQSGTSEFVAVYGRRRVGKTELVRKVFDKKFTFQVTGIANVQKKRQLLNFYTALQNYRRADDLPPMPENWFMAFQQLIKYLEASEASQKVIFFDELPWFDTPKSDFLQSLEHFWNSWASARDDILLVVCGSAASWMVNKLINHRGGLHNRVTHKIRLHPFNLKEAEQLLRLKNPRIDRYQVIQLYMAMGGIPFHLNDVSAKESAAQNIQRICFDEDGLLHGEFDNLFKALFRKAERHIDIVRTIAVKAKGLTRKEIKETLQSSESGTLTRTLDELEKSGFIRKYLPFGKRKRDSLYQLVDFYTLFYLRFIEKSNFADRNNWLNALDDPSVRAWSGYAFEQVCWYHIQQIKQALGIAGVITHTSVWRSKSHVKGAQIDLLIDRRDHVINICEMKFSIGAFTIHKNYAAQLQQKIQTFREETGTKKAIHLTMVTTYGIEENNWSINLVNNDIDMNVLFET